MDMCVHSANIHTNKDSGNTNHNIHDNAYVYDDGDVSDDTLEALGAFRVAHDDVAYSTECCVDCALQDDNHYVHRDLFHVLNLHHYYYVDVCQNFHVPFRV